MITRSNKALVIYRKAFGSHCHAFERFVLLVPPPPSPLVVRLNPYTSGIKIVLQLDAGQNRRRKRRERKRRKLLVNAFGVDVCASFYI